MGSPMHGRPGVRKGPQGQIVLTKTYSNFRYKVTMDYDGAIRVRPGDWLSKYSAAMNDDFSKINEFGRMDSQGRLRPLLNPNLIFAGETIYHIPTYRRAHPLRMEPLDFKVTPYSEGEIKKHISDSMKADFDLKGEHLRLAEEASHLVHAGDTAVTIGEIFGIVAEGAAGASALAVVSGFLVPVMIGIAVLNATETDMRIAGLQAVAYAVPAWAFGHSIPGYPASLKAGWSAWGGISKDRLPKAEAAWKESSEAAVRNMDAEVVKKQRQKSSYQAVWRALTNDEPKKLVRLVMEALEERVEWPARRESFWTLNPEQYPN